MKRQRRSTTTICWASWGGIRLGTPALTTRGFGVEEMERVAQLIDEVLVKRDDGTVERVKREVRELVEEFPLYAKGVGVGG